MKHLTGNLLDPDHGFEAIGHGVNLKGTMGAGIAAQIAHEWPGVLRPYKRACQGGKFVLGGVLPYTVDGGGPRIYNLATQFEPGPAADLDAIWSAVSLALVDCWRKRIDHLAIPEIGCGIGGLDWQEDVGPMLEDIDAASPVELIVVHYDG